MQSDLQVSTTKRLYRLLAVLVVCVVCLQGCKTTIDNNKIHVSIVDSVFFTVANPTATVEHGADYTAKLTFRYGYEFDGCDYADYAVTDDASGKTLLTLRNVTRPSRVTVTAKKVERAAVSFDIKCSIVYDYNGGADKDGETIKTISYHLTQHQRPNTDTAQTLHRDGHVLTGWNTLADGSGDHVGLGSRVTVANGGQITLYAEWAKSLNHDDLLYTLRGDEIVLTGYRGKGDVQPFVIPAEIDGKPVVEIGGSFTANMRCGTLSSQTLVLPNTMRNVVSNAFLHSTFSEIYFFDNIVDIDERAFPYNIGTWHINAFDQPCFQAENNSTIFADNMDRLILNKDKKKLIFFSGCSFSYGVDSNLVNEVYGDEYVVFNMGMNGDINGAFQMEILINYMGKGDIMVHAPEEMSPVQLMDIFFVNTLVFIMAEGNYDLLALADFSDNGGVVRAFFEYKDLKRDAEPCSYDQWRYCDFNIYGDYIEERHYNESTEAARDVTYSDNLYCFAPEMITDKGMAKLTGYYDKIRSKGGNVYLSYAPVNGSARGGDEIVQKGYEFARKLGEVMDKYGYEIISEVDDYILSGRYFFDSDYHLNDIGVALRTEQLLSDLAAVTGRAYK